MTRAFHCHFNCLGPKFIFFQKPLSNSVYLHFIDTSVSANELPWVYKCLLLGMHRCLDWTEQLGIYQWISTRLLLQHGVLRDPLKSAQTLQIWILSVRNIVTCCGPSDFFAMDLLHYFFYNQANDSKELTFSKLWFESKKVVPLVYLILCINPCRTHKLGLL